MIYLFFSVVFYTIAALLYKHANQLGCDRISLILSERIFAVFFMLLYMTFFDTFKTSMGLTLIASVGGVTIFLSRLALLASLKYGKISSSWTAVNLSVVIPIIASIFFWKEIPNIRQMLGLILVPLAIFLLQEDKKE
ncbi:MAG: EamA family transporter [Candidatus Omnitrophica bacterium]|nr:EamA family transporter [Candidatus Omnitrophota bacterium]